MSPVTVRIDVQAVDLVSYALAHNEISVVGSITLASEETVRAASVRVGIADAGGPLSLPCELAADMDAGRSTVLRTVPLRLDPAQMSQVEEQRPGWIDVEVSVGGVLLGQLRQPVKVLAANQWLRSSALVTTELLAAFVMPNHPAVGALLADASGHPPVRTGSGSLEGYSQVRSGWTTSSTRSSRPRPRTASATPSPGQLDRRGQKVRNPGEVLDGHVGSCLDTTVTLAAALEQAGLRPLSSWPSSIPFLATGGSRPRCGMIVDTEPDRSDQPGRPGSDRRRGNAVVTRAQARSTTAARQRPDARTSATRPAIRWSP